MTNIKVLSIEFSNEQNFRDFGGLQYADGVEVIEDVLGINDDDVCAIQKFGPNPRKIDISICSRAFDSERVHKALDEPTQLSSGKKICGKSTKSPNYRCFLLNMHH